MRFWDASAIVPLVCREPLSRRSRLLYREDPRLYPLRAADALQLGSALVGVFGRPGGFEFVTFDDILGSAAEREGFSVLGLD